MPRPGRRKRASRLGTVLPRNKRAELISRREKDEARLAARGERCLRRGSASPAGWRCPRFWRVAVLLELKTRRRRETNHASSHPDVRCRPYSAVVSYST